MTIHEQLVATRNEIAKRGWTQDIQEDVQGRVCLYGGLSHALYGRARIQADDPNLERFALVLGFRTALDATIWNNASDRTKEQVLARLDEAIARTAPMPADPLPADLLPEGLQKVREPVPV